MICNRYNVEKDTAEHFNIGEERPDYGSIKTAVCYSRKELTDCSKRVYIDGGYLYKDPFGIVIQSQL